MHRGVFLLPTLEPSKRSFVWQSYGRKFTHDRVRRAKMSIGVSFNSSTAYFGSTYGACKLYNCLTGTSKAAIHTDTDVLTEEIEQQPRQKAGTVGRRLPVLIPIQETAVDCDRRGAEWRKRQEHWQVPFVTDCWLL